ncbi:hypothetical protein FQA39_LY01942 [Lamprigera yunnana]|nr:hypothetical protein FQA39_LY01942 [Lamprigera yunnana]
MFETCTSLKVNENDGFSDIMCSNCTRQLENYYHFRQMCIESEIAMSVLRRKSSELTSNVPSDKPVDVENDLILRNHENHMEETSNYTCNECLEVFLNVEELERHSNLHEPFNAQENCNFCKQPLCTSEHCCEKTKGISKSYQCKECDKKYTSSHNLQIHMYSHTGTKPFSCEHCERKFTKVSSLNSHRTLHTGDLSYLCSECGKGFSTVTGLKRHKITHSGERPYKCVVCQAQFIMSGDLTVHMRTHTGERPYLCPTCGNTFSRISHLNTHLRRHTGERPYRCSKCDRAFAQSGDLRSHERTHTGEKPYECLVCNKKFIQCSGLASHMKTHTGEKSFNSSTKPKSIIKLLTGENSFDEKDIEVKQSWTINTKYYIAHVNIFGITDNYVRTDEFNNNVEALIIHMDSNKQTGLDDLEKWSAIEDDCNPEVKLLICNYCTSDTKVTKAKATEWCLRRGFELVELYPEIPNSGEDSDDEIIKERFGVDRIIEALQTHVWSNLILKETNVAQAPAQNAEVSGISDLDCNQPFILNSFLTREGTDDFTELFSQLHMIEESMKSMPSSQRKQCAEQMVTAFWNAIGGDEDELSDYN